MFIVYVIVAIALSLALLVSAAGKLTKSEQVVTMITGLGVPLSWFPLLAGAEIAGAAGLLIGLGVAGTGIVAALGVIAYFVGTITYHVRANDTKGAGPAIGLAVVAALAFIARIASA